MVIDSYGKQTKTFNFISIQGRFQKINSRFKKFIRVLLEKNSNLKNPSEKSTNGIPLTSQ